MADKRITKDEASRQMSAADKRIKGISSIASNTIKRTKSLELQKEYGTSKGNKQAVSSVDKALRSLTLSTEALARGVKMITVETARGVKNITVGGAKAMNEYARAITQDININRQSFMVTTIGRFTPMVGYAVAKMMETSVFRNMIEKMKYGLGRALDSVTSRFKKLTLAGWNKGKDIVNYVLDIGSNKRGAVKTRMAKARSAKADKKYYTQESAIKAALADAKVSNLIREKSKKKEIESQVPHMATGGYVKKEGLAKVHAAEVVQPIDKITETIVKIVNERLDKRDSNKDHESGMTSYFKKAKKTDLFGFEKVSRNINTVFEIMTRKSLKLETRIMKRDRLNQRGLIKSFMSAYTEEAKQEELPLMERQVRATLELKKTISGDNKTLSAAISKMFYEHPMFYAMSLGMKAMYKTVSLPTKFLFKKRGIYANDLSSGGTVFERLLDANSQLYSGVMEKLDDVIANTYVIANTTGTCAAKCVADGGPKKPKTDARKAPGQKGWSFAGLAFKALYATHVKAPAAVTKWLAGKFGMSDKMKDFLFKERSVKDEAIKFGSKLWNKWKGNAEYNAGRIGGSILNRGKQASDWLRNKINDTNIGKKRSIFNYRQKIISGQDKAARDKAKMIRDIRSQENPDGSKKSNWIERAGAAGGTLAGKLFNKAKSIGESFGRDRTGKKSTASYLNNLVKYTKENMLANKKSNKIQGKMLKRLSKWKEYLFSALMMVGSAVGNVVSKIGGIGGWILEKLAQALGGAKVLDWIKSIFSKSPGSGTKAPGALMKAITKIPKVGKLVGGAAAILGGGGLIAKMLGGGAEVGAATGGATTSAAGAATSAAGAATSTSGAKVGAKFGAKAIGKSIAKKLPVVGLLYGLYDGFQRAKEGDWVGAAMSIGSGAAAMGGPAGIGLSLALDAGQAARDFKKERNTKNEEFVLKKKAEEAKKEEEKNSWSSKFMNVFNPTIEEKPIVKKPWYKRMFGGNEYENLTPEQVKKIKSMQQTAVEFAPLINQFAGGTTIGLLVSQHLAKFSSENPEKIVSIADKVVGVSREAWVKAGHPQEMWDAAKLIYDNKGDYIKTWKERAKSSTQYLFEQAQAAKSKGKSYFEKMDKKSGGALTRAMNEVSSLGSNAIEKGKEVYENSDSAKAAVSFVKTGAINAADIAKHGVSTIMANLYEVMQNLPSTISSMSNTISSKLNQSWNFFKDIYGDPVQYYKDTKEQLWGGISKVWLYLGALYEKVSGEKIPNFVNSISLASSQMMTSAANQVKTATEKASNYIPQNVKTKAKEYTNQAVNNISKLTGGRVVERNLAGKKYILKESDFNSSSEFEEATRMNLFKLKKYYPNIIEKQEQGVINGKKVATMGAQSDINKAELNSSAFSEGLNNVKNSVDKYSRAATNMISNVVNNSSNSSNSNSSVVNSGSNNSNNSRPIDSFTQSILLGNI